MRKLNNKGMTTTELLITFVIVASVVLSLYISIANLRSKEIIASYKQSITTYKDLLTREIQNDLIMRRLTSVETTSGNYEITLVFSDNVTKTLKIHKAGDYKNSTSTACNNPEGSVNDSIIYGDEEYQLPSLGTSAITTINGKCMNVNNLSISMDPTKTRLTKVNDLVVIKINLFHPDLGDKYSINIVAPINYNK